MFVNLKYRKTWGRTKNCSTTVVSGASQFGKRGEFTLIIFSKYYGEGAK